MLSDSGSKCWRIPQPRKRSYVNVTGIRKLHTTRASCSEEEGETGNTTPNGSVYEEILVYACCSYGSRAKKVTNSLPGSLLLSSPNIGL